MSPTPSAETAVFAASVELHALMAATAFATASDDALSAASVISTVTNPSSAHFIIGDGVPPLISSSLGPATPVLGTTTMNPGPWPRRDSGWLSVMPSLTSSTRVSGRKGSFSYLVVIIVGT